MSTAAASPSITFVTALVDLSKYELRPADKTLEAYLELGIPTLKLPFPLVIFGDADTTLHISRLVKEHRPRSCPEAIVEMVDTASLPSYCWSAGLEENAAAFMIKNRNNAKDSVLYALTGYAKFDYLDQVIRSNPFRTTHVGWVDFGISHVAVMPDGQQWRQIFSRIPDEIRQMCIRYVTPDELGDKASFFQFIWHNVAGGFFTGRTDYMARYVEWFRQEIGAMIANGLFQLDEAVMAVVGALHPSAFDYYYGDYQGILMNYDELRFNDDIVWQNLLSCRAHNQAEAFQQIIAYLARNPARMSAAFYEALKSLRW